MGEQSSLNEINFVVIRVCLMAGSTRWWGSVRSIKRKRFLGCWLQRAYHWVGKILRLFSTVAAD